MHLPLALVVTLATSTLAIPAPTPVPTPDSSSPRAALRGSARNVYLTTCTTRSLSADSTSSSAILYNSGDTSSSNPSDVGTVLSESAIQWAGYTRRVPLGSGIFESKIDKGAETLEKSQIAGSAKLRLDLAKGHLPISDSAPNIQFQIPAINFFFMSVYSEYLAKSTNDVGERYSARASLRRPKTNPTTKTVPYIA
ncbi:hypothetical protein TUN199_02176 [Pyrenophora tritici-repentis]|nr:hypothetical protein Alg215_07242 [Pyrenophora tritici-repentis]KAI0625782.1 hypothetical protein TUN199_02176 [Pyrenophora tritici-repentis]PZD24966.1 hypothetical protein A1F96_08864 [Pyrenophora tritici-repentis]